MKKLELVRAFRMQTDNEHVAAYKKVFPHARPTIFQMELIEETVKDPEAWRKTLIFWGGNNYRAESVFKMLEYYKEAKQGKPDVGRSNYTEPQVKCGDCFDTGEVRINDASAQFGIRWMPCRCREAA
jgi:hypothetical protein